MYDGGKIIAGLVIGVGLLMFPFFYNAGKAAKVPEPVLTEKAKEAKECVAPTPYMQAYHMQLLDDWRHEVVRDGDRYYTTGEMLDKRLDKKIISIGKDYFAGVDEESQVTPGKVHYKSLQVTCLECHSNKSKFCDQCHDYMGVDPYCWDCHLEPEEKK